MKSRTIWRLRWTPAGQAPERAALEGLALEAYRQRRISGYQLRTLLGITSRSVRWVPQLKEHKVYDYTLEDLDRDLAGIREFREKQAVQPA